MTMGEDTSYTATAPANAGARKQSRDVLSAGVTANASTVGAAGESSTEQSVPHLSLDAPIVPALWFYATDVAVYDPKALVRGGSRGGNASLSNTTPSATRIASAKQSEVSTASDSVTEALSLDQSTPANGMPATSSDAVAWEQVGQVESSRLENMYTMLQKWRSDSKSSFSRPDFQTTLHLPPDWLYEISVEAMLRYPIYWSGPIYEVRRATWFTYASGSRAVPCDAILDAALETGYHKVQPWLYRAHSVGSTQVRFAIPEHKHDLDANSFAVYSSDCQAWILQSTVAAKIQQTLFSRLTSGVNLGGQRVVRGYDNLCTSPKDAKEKQTEEKLSKCSNNVSASVPSTDSREQSITPTNYQNTNDTDFDSPFTTQASGSRAKTPSSNLRSPVNTCTTTNASDDCPKNIDPPGIDHLLFVVHGIGSKLSEKTDSVNFLNDVGLLRKGIETSIQSNVAAVGNDLSCAKNVFVLPINWRQFIDFGDTSEDFSDSEDEDSGAAAQRSECKANDSNIPNFNTKSTPKKQQQQQQQSQQTLAVNNLPGSSGTLAATALPLGNLEGKKHHLPSLAEVLVTSDIPLIHTVISDVVLDIMLFMTPRHRAAFISSAAAEMNRVYRLFCSRHLSFRGPVSIFGHSLGSALSLQILSEFPPAEPFECAPSESWRNGLVPNVNGNLASVIKPMSPWHPPPDNKLEFDVHDLYMAGSPVGYLFLLFGTRLRPLRHANEASTVKKWRPRLKRLYNMFSRYDPIVTRLEPFVSREFTLQEPVEIPYFKGGLKGLQNTLNSSRAVVAFRSSTSIISAFLRPLTNPTTTQLQNPISGLTSFVNGALPFMTRSSNAQKQSSAGAEETEDSPEDELKRKRERERAMGGIHLLNPKYDRIDFSLQKGILENGYLAAITSHTSYWTDQDIAAFFAGELCDTSF